MGSTRAELPKNVLGVDEAAGSDIGTGFAEGLVKRGTLALIEPIAGIERQELQFGPFRQVCRLIHDEAPLPNSRFDGHVNERSIGGAAQQANGAVAAEVLCKYVSKPRGSFASVGQTGVWSRVDSPRCEDDYLGRDVAELHR